MHSEQKLGLALGVLLIGITAALFFPKEPATSEDEPQLKNPQQLDAEIAEVKTHTPYLEQEESQKSARKQVAQQTKREEKPNTQQSHTAQSAKSPEKRLASEMPSFLERELAQLKEQTPFLNDKKPGAHADNPFEAVSRVKLQPLPATPPEPDEAVTQVVPIPQHNNAWTVVDKPARVAENTKDQQASRKGRSKSSAARNASNRENDLAKKIVPAKSSEKPERPSPRTIKHTVVRGDTLSGLAAKYLGSSAKYNDIYKLNDNVMKSPDDLKIGMVLQIPAQSDSAASNDSAKASSGDDGDAGQSKQRLFEPIHRYPLAPR